MIAFAAPQPLASWVARLRPRLGELRVLADPERILYGAFGLGRASVRRVWLDPRVWARYAELILRGRRPRRAEQDPLQLGGDVLVDAQGIVRWIYRSRGPEDRPSGAEIAAARVALNP